MSNYPVTQAIRFLKSNKINFEPFLFEYLEKGGTKHTSEVLKVDEHLIIKTLVMESEAIKPFIILMHGDKEVSTKELARQIGFKSIAVSDMKNANKYTGYEFGGTSPFGTLRQMNLYIESSIFDLEEIYINGGKRGFIIKINSNDLNYLNNITKVNAAI